MNGAAGRWLTPLSIGVLAFALRAVHAPAVFLGTHVQLSDPDAYYHMRRILFTLVNFPQTLGVDPYLAPPAGGQAIWPPLFDAAMAWLLLPLWAPGGESAVEHAAAWVPPLLGALTAVGVWAVGRRLFDPAVGAVAGLLVGILPLHVHYSKVGFVDHHAAVALAAIGLIAVTAWLLRVLIEPTPRLRGRVAATTALGVGLGGSLLLWPGGLVHVGAVVVTLLLFAPTRGSREASVRAASAAAAGYGIAFLLVAPSSLAASSPQFGAWTPVVLSRFQPWLFAALACHALACAGLWRAGVAGERAATRFVSSLLLGLALLGLSAAAFPGLADGALDAERWLTRDETFQAMVAESQPLLHVRGEFSAGALRRQFGDLGHALPFLLVWLVWAARRRPDRDGIFLVAVWTVLVFGAALTQRRFANSASLPFALVTAWGIVALARLLSDRVAGGSRAVTAGVSALLLIAGTAAFTPVYGPRTAAFAAFLRNGPDPARRPDRIGAMVALGEWLRGNTPPTRGFFDPDERPEYTVLAMWGHGHVIRYVGRRAPVVDNFGDDVSPESFAASLRYFGSRNEAEGLAVLDRFGTRYVVVDPINVQVFAGRGPRSLSHRLYRFDGTGLGHHRLVHDLAGAAPGAPPGAVPYKVFERVAGARLRGRAAPGETIVARLSFSTSRGRRGQLEWSAQADADGRFELVVPHASASRGAITTGASYVLEAGGGSTPVGVDEADVVEGGAVEVPPFAPANGSPS